MIKDIRYKGYTANPSDYECEDGELAMSLNVIHEDGALRPVLKPKAILQLGTDAKVIYVHENTAYTNYIIFNESKQEIYWKNIDSNKGDLLKINGYKGSVIAVGNTLVFSIDSGTHYFLWKDGTYTDLGTELPELNASPYIHTNIKTVSSIKTEYKIISEDGNGIISGGDKIPSTICKELYNGTINNVLLSGTERQNIYNKVFNTLNFYSSFLKSEGFFLEPFYVRFAYRMYDGSHTKHTVPVLLSPITLGKPLMDVKIGQETAMFNPLFFTANLYATILLNNIDDWKDIITDIDVFVTEPLVDYSDSPESLLAIKKYSWEEGNSHLSPHMMTARQTGSVKTYEWASVQEYLYNQENTTSLSYDIFPYSKLVFKRVKAIFGGYYHRGSCKYKSSYSGFNGYFAIENKGYTIYKSSLDGIMIPGLTELEGFETGLSLTFFNIEDVKGLSIFYTDEKIDDKEIEFKTYLILRKTKIEFGSGYCIETKRVDGKSYEEVLKSYNSFYNIASINLSNIKDGCFDDLIPLKDGALKNITTRQTLSDLGQCHNKVIANYFFNYNNRLNIVQDRVQFKNPTTSLRKQNPAVCRSSRITYDEYTSSVEKLIYAYVEIYENEQTVYVEIPIEDYSSEGFQISELQYFSFPNNNAKKLILFSCLFVISGMTASYEYRKFVIPLQQHDFLNLSYAFDNFKSIVDEQNYDIVDDETYVKMPNTNNIVKYGNIIRLSDVNNPFRFSEEFTVSLPVKEIYALSTAAKALSQGQFGQYPLYAFTSDGIWALELTSTGTYSARQPISRDVVLNKESITQIDNSVLFATDRGIMLISGSQVVCISDKINTMDQFTLNELPKADKLMAMYNAAIDDINKIPSQNIPSIPGIISPTIPPAERSLPTGDKSDISLDDVILLPFNEFLANCRMIYDYAHQHIIVYNPEVRYAYVYSLKSQLWGMMYSKITHNVNSYPEALAMENSRLVDFSKTGNDKAATMIVTRPLDMGEPDAFKTISTIIQRGNMNDKMKQVLYGSNDLNNWFVVWSSDNKRMSGFSGSPWKYYRIVMIREFDKSESIYGFSVQYVPKLGNRLR